MRVFSRVIHALGWAAPCAMVLVLATTSGTLSALLASGGVLLVAFSVGLAPAARLPRVTTLERAALAIGIGLGIETLAAFALAAIGALRPLPVALCGLGLATAGVALARRDVKPVGVQGDFTMALLVIAVTPFLAAPETKWDAVWYHVPLAAAIAQTGTLAPLPNLVQSFFPLSGELLSAVAILFGSLDAARYMHFGAGLASALAVGALGARVGAKGSALLAAIAWLAMPVVLWEMTTAYIDLFAALFAALAMLEALRWMAHGSTADALMCGVFLGLAVGVKLTVAVVALPLGVAILLVHLRRRDQLAQLVGLVMAAALVASPWYVRAFALTGNPVFPFLNAVFQSAQWDPVNVSEDPSVPDVTAASAVVQVLTGGCTWAGMPLPCLGVIPLLAVVALVALVLRRGPRGLVFLAAVLLLGTPLWLLVGPVERYLLPLYPAACALVAALGAELMQRRRAARLLPVGVAASALAALASLALLQGTPPHDVPWRVDLGLEEPEKYVARHLESFTLFLWMDAHLPPDARTLVIGHSDLALAYTPRPIYPARFTLDGRRVVAAADVSEALALLRQAGFRYVIVESDPKQRDEDALTRSDALGTVLPLIYAATPRLALYEVPLQ